MVAVNLGIQDGLINSQPGNISHVKFAQIIVQKESVKYSDEQAGLKATRLSYLIKTLGFLLKNVKLRFRKERINISIHHAHLNSFKISIEI